MAWLRLEVSKFLKNHRISETTLKELEAKVQVEVYIREKRDAILKDREDSDTESHLERVQ